MLGIFIFTTKQPERSFGSRPCHNTRLVRTNAGKHRQAMTALGKDISLRIHKIFRTENTDILHSRNLIHVMEAGIDNRNRHTLPFESGFMELIAVAQLNLSNGTSVNTIRVHCRLIDHGIPFRCHRRFVGTGRNPDLFRGKNKRQCCDSVNQSCIVARYRYKIIPFPGHYDSNSLLADFIYIFTTNRKVGRVNGKILFLAAFNCSFRQELFRPFQRILCGSLVFQANAILQCILLCRYPCCKHGNG